MMDLVCSLFFPFAMLIAGGYLLARGLRRPAAAEALRGRVSSSGAFESHITRTKCVYSRVVVEQYRRGHDPWERVFSVERREPFTVSGRKVDPARADMRTSLPTAYVGYMRPGKGLVQELSANLRQVQGLADITSEVAPNEYLDDQVIVALLAIPGARDRLRKHMGKALRVTEHVISASSEVSVFADPSMPQAAGAPISGTEEFPLIITDSAAARAKSIMSEKSLASIALGALLIIGSLCILAFLLLM